MGGLAVLLWERAGSTGAAVLVLAGVLDLVLSLFFFRSSMDNDQ